MRAFYYLFSSAILACNLFFQVEAVIPNKIAESATSPAAITVSPEVAQPTPNEPSIESMWCRRLTEVKVPGRTIYQYLKYKKEGNYSMDGTIAFTDKLLTMHSQKSGSQTNGQYGLYHTALRIQSTACEHKERCKAQALPGVWINPAEEDSIIYELTFSKEEDIKRALKILNNRSTGESLHSITCVCTKIDKLTDKRLNVTEPTSNPVSPYASYKYKKKTELTTIAKMDSLQTSKEAVNKMKVFEDQRQRRMCEMIWHVMKLLN